MIQFYLCHIVGIHQIQEAGNGKNVVIRDMLTVKSDPTFTFTVSMNRRPSEVIPLIPS